MTTRTLTVMLVAAIIAIGAAITLNASVPVGVYASVDQVVFEPNEAEPERVRVSGVFALWDEEGGNGYDAPQRGYLYYSCSRQHVTLCRNEWADLKSVAGTGQIIGFGSRSLLAGRVRSANDRASAPDVYPIQFGVVRMGSSPRGAIFDQLKALTRAK